MQEREKVLFKGKTEYDQYQIIDMVYEGRKARILFSGDKSAAFSGMPLDDEHTLLFDYIQRFFELISQVRPCKLLMIGGGVYTLPMALIHALPDISIDVVEIDSGLDELAEGFFGFEPNERLKIIHADGKDFLTSHENKYDMIIIDAFSDLNIPDSLASTDTPELIHERLTKNGIVAINVISSYKGRRACVIEKFYSQYSAVFDHTTIYPADNVVSLWMSQNFLLISQKGQHISDYGLRFGSLDTTSI